MNYHAYSPHCDANDDSFEVAVTSIVDRMHCRSSPVGKGSAWAAMVSQFRERAHCDLGIVGVLEAEISAHLVSLRVEELRRLWTTSVSGMGGPGDSSTMSAGELRRLLEPELLARITEIAAEET